MFDNYLYELMGIFILLKILLVFFIVCWIGCDVLFLEFSYIYLLKNVIDENVCFLDWVLSKVVCEFKLCLVSKGRLYCYDGKEVFFILR